MDNQLAMISHDAMFLISKPARMIGLSRWRLMIVAHDGHDFQKKA